MVKLMKRYLMVSKGHTNFFSASWPSKKQLGRSREIEVIIRRLALKTHNLTTGRLKHDICEVEESIFHGVEGPCELIFCILESYKPT
jgi:hypothetical protein